MTRRQIISFLDSAEFLLLSFTKYHQEIDDESTRIRHENRELIDSDSELSMRFNEISRTIELDLYPNF